jgi:hypothetical protein
MESKTERIDGWICNEVGGLRGAVCGTSAASYDNGHLVVFGVPLPAAVLAWLTRPAASEDLGLFRPVLDGGDPSPRFVPVSTRELPQHLSHAAREILAGLVRAAELLEGRDVDKGMQGIWDSRAASALAQARAIGWALGALEAPVHTEPAPSLSWQPPFEEELAALLNRYSLENCSNTPDFILAGYLKGCLDNWNAHTKKREAWYGTTLRPGSDGSAPTATVSG